MAFYSRVRTHLVQGRSSQWTQFCAKASALADSPHMFHSFLAQAACTNDDFPAGRVVITLRHHKTTREDLPQDLRVFGKQPSHLQLLVVSKS